MAFRTNLFILALIPVALLSACGGGGSSGGSTAPSNALPRAVVAVSVGAGYAPLSVDFDGTQSSDPDGSITSYTWHMGDGSSYAGSQISHTYSSLGTFEATLTITDDDGASSTASLTIDVFAQAAGYYTGRLFSNVTQETTEVEVIIGANHQIHAWDWFNFRSSYWGTFAMDVDGAAGTLAAEIWEPGFVFPDGTTFGSVDFSATVAARQDISGTYIGVGDTGTIDVQYVANISERQSSLEEISGAWIWTDGVSFTETIILSETGGLSYSNTDGCTAQGQLTVLDPNLNGFGFQIDWSCPGNPDPAWNGPSSGIAFVDDFYDPGTDWLIFAESIGDGTTSDVWGPSRPTATATTPNLPNAKLGPTPNKSGGGRAARFFGRGH